MSRGLATDPATVDEVVEMYSNGLKAVAIHNEIGLPVPTIYRIIREADMRTLDGDAMSPTAQAAFIEGYLNREPIHELARRLNVSINTGFALLRKAGIDVRSRSDGASSARRRETAVRMYKEDISVLDILTETGISSTALYKELRRRKIPLRTRPRNSGLVVRE